MTRPVRQPSSSYRPYAEYRESGVEWLGDIPVHWDLKRLRFCARLNPSAAEIRAVPPDTEVSFVPMEAIGEYGGLDLSRTKVLTDLDAGYTYFRDGDVVVAKITPCFENGKGALAESLKNAIAFGTTELHVLRALPALDHRYLFYVTLSTAFRRLGEGYMYGAGGQKRVPESFVLDLRHPIPPAGEQRAIASFLDRETGRIDALVAKNERLIEVLQEQRSALVTHAVTKGLDPGAQWKDSGVKWLGEIPVHWQVKRLSWLTRCLDGRRVPLNAEERGMMQGEYPYWGANSIVDQIDQWLFDEDLVLLGEDGAPFFDPARAVAFAVSGKIWVNNHAHVLRPGQNVATVFLAHALNCVDYHAFIDGTTRDKLTQADMSAIPIQLPPLEEQQAIAAHLERETARIDCLITRVREAVECLKELHVALICAAVTGSIDVRNSAA